MALAVDPRNQEVIDLIEEVHERIRIDNICTAAAFLGQSDNVKELQQAIERFDEVLRLDSNHEQALKLKSEAEARLQVQELLGAAKHDFAKGRYKDSRRKINRVLERHPENKVALSYLEHVQRYEQLRQKNELARRAEQEARSKRKRAPVKIVKLTAEKSTLTTGEQSRLTVVAGGPNPELLRYEWSALLGTITGLDSEVTYTAPMEVPADHQDKVTVSVGDESGMTASRVVSLTITPPKARVILTEAQKLRAKELFIEGYRFEKEPTIRNIPKAIGYYEQAMQVAPDPTYLYYQKAGSRLFKLEAQDRE